jgi:hypothetical protein
MKRLNGQFPPCCILQVFWMLCCYCAWIFSRQQSAEIFSFSQICSRAAYHFIKNLRHNGQYIEPTTSIHLFYFIVVLFNSLVRTCDIMDSTVNLILMYIIWFYSSKAITWAMLHVFEVVGCTYDHLLYFLFLIALLICFSFNALTIRNWKEEKKLHPEVYYFLCMFFFCVLFFVYVCVWVM